MLQDLKHAVRLLMQTKGWTAVVLLSLAIGIGANTALFSGVNGILLRTVPVPEPDSLVRLRGAGPNDMKRSWSSYGYNGKNAAGEDIRETTSYPVYQALLSTNQTLTDIAASAPSASLNVIADGTAELATALEVSGNYFQLLRVGAQIGRTLTPEDDRPSAPPVAVISYGYWRRRFGGSPTVLGRVVRINNVPVTIVGVTPEGFTGIQTLEDPGKDVTVPLSMDQLSATSTKLQDGTLWWLQLVGRLKPGSSFARVRGNLEGTFQGAARNGWTSYFSALPADQQGLADNQNRTAVPHLEVDSASQGIYAPRPETLRSAWILSAVVALILLIVCANVANLLLSRAAARQKELSVRLALGATRSRLLRQLLTESMLLAAIGGGLGILVASWSRPLLPFGQTAPLDWRVLSFALALCVATAMTFGLVPAVRTTRVDLSGAMQETSRSVSSSRSWLGKGLLVAQVAISLLLLIGAGLFLRTLQNLRNVNAGFNTQHLIVFGINPRLNGYDASRVATLYDELQQRLSSLSGVQAVSHSQIALLSGSDSETSMYLAGKPESAGADGSGLTLWDMKVSPEFFQTLEMTVLRGRNLDRQDSLPNAPAVAVINEAAARQFFAGEDPIGRRFGTAPEKSNAIEIVGIVGDAKYANLRDPVPPTGFRPFPHQTNTNATFEVRVSGPPDAMLQAIRDTVRQTDPNLPLVRITTQNDLLEGRFDQEHFFAMAYSLFGGVALLLAGIGLFGLMSYNVARRGHEIGIRTAIGARRSDIMRMVLGESLLLVSLGIVVGLGLTVAAGRLIQSMLFGLGPTDGVTIILAVSTMFVVAVIVGYLPARRASHIDPVTALRSE